MRSKILSCSLSVAAVATATLSMAPAALAQMGGANYNYKVCDAKIGNYKYSVFPYGSAGLAYAVQVWTIATGQKYGEFVVKRDGVSQKDPSAPSQGTAFGGADGITFFSTTNQAYMSIKDAQNGGAFVLCTK